jgi:pimeloyl-ACP methyl ester carboxylesterase
MAFAEVNNTKLFYSLEGSSGPPLVLIHGSWGDHHNWDPVAPALSEHFRVLRYDRRGHSQSDAPEGQGSVLDDASDIAALVEHLDLAPAHVVGNSFGASISLRFASTRPDLIRSLIVHEPPLIGLLAGDTETQPFHDGVMQRINDAAEILEQGNLEAGAKQFVETIGMGPGGWDRMAPEQRQTNVTNALTWLDEVRDPDALTIDAESLAAFDHPTLLSQGDQSPPFFAVIVGKIAEAIPSAKRRTFAGAGHVPYASHPAEYVDMVRTFIA